MRVKGISLCFAFIMILEMLMLPQVSASKGSGDFTDLEALAIVNTEIVEKVSDIENKLTRAEFSYILAHLYERKTFVPLATRFTDVTEEHKYSGYVDMLSNLQIMNGVGDGLFKPDAPILAEHVYKLVIDYLGYDAFASDYGYKKTLERFNLTKNVVENADGTISVISALNLINNIVFKYTYKMQYRVENGEFITAIDTNDKKTVLGDKLGISVWKGQAHVVDLKKNTISITVTGNKYETNYKQMAVGDTLTLKLQEGLDAYSYEYMPVTVWTDKEDNVISLVEDARAEIKYAIVASVNNDTNKNGSYAIRYIDEIMLLNDETEYDVSNTATLKYNGSMTSAAKKLIGKYAKIVIYDDEIIHIETWEFEEGGIITKFNAGTLNYTKGDAKNLSFKNFAEYSNRLYFIGNRRASESEVKPDSVFYYYTSGDSIVMLISEYIVSDKFTGISNGNMLLLGDYTFKYDPSNLYTSVDGNEYTKDANLNYYMGLDVKAYLAPDDSILYLTCLHAEDYKVEEFYAAFVGIKTDNNLGNEEARIRLHVIDDEPYVKDFSITKNTRYNGTRWKGNEATIEAALSATTSTYSSVLTGSSIFKFKVNSSGNILEINTKEDFHTSAGGPVIKDLGTATETSLEFVYLDVNADGNEERIHFAGPITVLYDDDGKLGIGRVLWADLYNGTIFSAATYLRLFGEEYSSVPSLMLLYGGVDTYRKQSFSGVIKRGGKVIDEDGSVVDYFVTLSGEKLLIESKDVATLGEYNLATILTDMPFNNKHSMITSCVNLSDSPSTWTTLKCGTVKKYDGIRLYTEEGAIEFAFAYGNGPTYYSYDVNRKEKFKQDISQQDIRPGDTVYWQSDKDGITTIILIK